MKASILIGAGVFLLLNGTALAMPGQSENPAQEHADRFKTMDSNSDGLLVWAEFEAAMPQMRKEAFDSIDADKNGSITPAEWEAFRKTHGMKGAAPGKMAPGNAAPAPAKPLIQPPKN